ncbi:placenta-specific gene 8 protein-like isoform X2 [Ostrea edulis]|nr:placenta-specific gene 8 protein-like isoform X2 [Ostrea edulis]XP_056014741.1 placenta-specific gene 8 protein-like isoform X2 [Ostrea edulis]
MANQVVVVQQPVANSGNPLMVTGIDGHRHWSTGLFDCFSDITSCLMGYFCLPCTICSVASRTGECCCMPYCVPGGTILMRNRIRTIGGIQGSACNDCMVMSCCGVCAVCQMQRELDNMGLP